MSCDVHSGARTGFGYDIYFGYDTLIIYFDFYMRVILGRVELSYTRIRLIGSILGNSSHVYAHTNYSEKSHVRDR